MATPHPAFKSAIALLSRPACVICRELTFFPCPDGVCASCVIEGKCACCEADARDSTSVESHAE